MTSPIKILNEHWGYSSFKPLQEEIIESVLNGQDTVALLPTGGGKSICFQIPAIVRSGICIVVSPLVALMSDQVSALAEKGIKALAITGGLSVDDLTRLLDNAKFGNYKFLYLSPERLQQELVQLAIRQMDVNLIAIDEAHCISQWGNDFRPSYKKITILRALQPLVPIIALTATATPEVLDDTIQELNLELPNIFKSSFFRHQLAYKVYREPDKLYRIESLLKSNSESAIVYIRSRSAAVDTCNKLNELGIDSAYYHGGMHNSEKLKNLAAWKKGDVSTMVATNAFGMGIDRANVRFVIHMQLPESIESYFQEAGRAGRDGNYSSAILLFDEHDKDLIKKQYITNLPQISDLKKLYKQLNNYFQISYGEGEFTEHSFNFSEFCKIYKLNISLTYNTLNTLDRIGIIKLSKQFGRKSTLLFLISSEKLLNYFEKDQKASVIGKTILRIYGGIFETPTTINLDVIQSKTGVEMTAIISVLKQMEKDKVVDLTLHETDATITFNLPREDEKTINPWKKHIETINEKKIKQVNAMLSYIDNNKECKSVQLLKYFGEEDAESCGICSVCSSQNSAMSKKESRIIAKDILKMLEESSMTSREISERLTFTESKIIKTLQLLLDSRKIVINTMNQYNLS